MRSAPRNLEISAQIKVVISTKCVTCFNLCQNAGICVYIRQCALIFDGNHRKSEENLQAARRLQGGAQINQIKITQVRLPKTSPGPPRKHLRPERTRSVKSKVLTLREKTLPGTPKTPQDTPRTTSDPTKHGVSNARF